MKICTRISCQCVTYLSHHSLDRFELLEVQVVGLEVQHASGLELIRGSPGPVHWRPLWTVAVLQKEWTHFYQN